MHQRTVGFLTHWPRSVRSTIVCALDYVETEFSTNNRKAQPLLPERGGQGRVRGQGTGDRGQGTGDRRQGTGSGCILLLVTLSPRRFNEGRMTASLRWAARCACRKRSRPSRSGAQAGAPSIAGANTRRPPRIVFFGKTSLVHVSSQLPHPRQQPVARLLRVRGVAVQVTRQHLLLVDDPCDENGDDQQPREQRPIGTQG